MPAGETSPCLETFDTNDFNLTASLKFSRGLKPVVLKNVSESDIVLVEGNPCVYGKYMLENGKDIPHLQENGTLVSHHLETKFAGVQSLNEYCLENMMLDDTGTTRALVYYLCFPDESSYMDERHANYVKYLARG